MDLRCHRLEAARARPTVRRYVADVMAVPLATDGSRRPGEDAAMVLRALRRLRAEHAIPAFGVALWEIAGVELDEEDAEACLAGMAVHREQMGRSLGRDPGWSVVAADFLSREHPMIHSLAVEEGVARDEQVDSGALVDRITAELRRSARSGRTFTLLLLEAAEDPRLLTTRVAETRRAMRETDRLLPLADGRLALLLPETEADGARVIGERLVELHARLGGASVRLGWATTCGEGQAEALIEQAAAALAEGRAPASPWNIRDAAELDPRRGADER